MERDYDGLMKKYRRVKIFAAILLCLFAATLYLCYDYAMFKVIIAGNYIFTDTLEKVYENVLGEENVRGYFYDFDRMVIAVVTEKLRSVSGDRYTYLYTPYGYKASKAAEKADAAGAGITELDEDTIYLRLPNISKGTSKFVLANQERLAGYKNITIDLRGNYGGMLQDYYKIARLFLDDGMTIGYESTRLPLFTRHITAKAPRKLNYDSIRILQDANTASSAEGLIMALKENLDNVELVGDRTYGKGIGQITVPLTGGYAVKATVLLINTPGGDSIHGVGIEPDVYVELE